MKDKLFHPVTSIIFGVLMFLIALVNVEQVDAANFSELTWGKIPAVLFCVALAWGIGAQFIKRKK